MSGTDELGYSTEIGEKIVKGTIKAIEKIGNGFLYGIGLASAFLLIAKLFDLV